MTPLQSHIEKWKNCTRCELSQHRNKVVLIKGSVPCDVLFIGEAPGRSEDIIGTPFIGPAGKLMHQIMNECGLVLNQRGRNWAMTNLVGCIPLDEDNEKTAIPPSAAIKNCAPRLVEIVRLCKPRLIVCVGKLSRQHVIGQAQFCLPQEDMQPSWIPQGKFLEFIEIVHPAAILRANIAQRSLAIQRAIVTLRNALAEI